MRARTMMTPPDTASVIPPLGPLQPPKLPVHASYRLASGLTVYAVRQAATPMTHIRLRLPSTGAPVAAGLLLAQWMFRPDRLVDGVPFAERAADCGARFAATVDVDNIQVTAHCLDARLDDTVRLLTAVMVDPTLVTTATEHDLSGVAHMTRVAKSRPGLLALEALNAAAYGTHPYALPSPDAAQIMATTIDDVDALRETTLRPGGASLAVVGDHDPDAVATLVDSASAGWSGVSEHTVVPSVPDAFTDALHWHHIPGSVRTSIHLALRVPRRTSHSYAALKVANLILGGYFSSRLNAELRERRGLCYSVRSAFAHTRAGAVILVSAEVDSRRSSEGLSALRDVLAGMNDHPITPDEHAHARRYAVGAQQLAQATHAELADWAIELAQEGTDIDWLRRHSLSLANVDLASAREASERFFRSENTAIGVAGDREVGARGH